MLAQSETVQLARRLVPVGAQPLEHGRAVLERRGQDVDAGLVVEDELAVHQQVLRMPILGHNASDARPGRQTMVPAYRYLLQHGLLPSPAQRVGAADESYAQRRGWG